MATQNPQRPKPQRIVMKFGGTSMAGTERIRRVAGLVRGQAAGANGTRNEVAVVVSAMAGETDRLVGFCREANPLHDPAEYDVVVSSGEQVTSGLLALTLQSLGEKARSWLGWQIPVKTVEAHAKARVETIEAPQMLEAMERAGTCAGLGALALSWRRVRDPDGDEVWMQARMLSAQRTALITVETELKRDPDVAARSKARLKPGVIAELVACEQGWCKVEIERKSGYLPQSALWGTEIETGNL